jgi:hypothetical protein
MLIQTSGISISSTCNYTDVKKLFSVVKFISIIPPHFVQYEQVSEKLMSRVFDEGEKYVKFSVRNAE